MSSRKDVPKTVTFTAPPNAGNAAGAPSSDDSPQKVLLDQAETTFGGPVDASSRYERKRIIGQGGMGTIVLVEDRTIGRNIALKQLNFDATTDEDRARFAREARVQGQLEHPAIVPVYDVGSSADGKPFFTMKRVRGESLQEILEQMAEGKPSQFSRRKLLSAFSQLCAAVHYAHERGVVHRDIKPTNVMLGSYGEVYLLDWGVAKIAGEMAERQQQHHRQRQQSDEQIDARAGVQTGYGAVMGTLTTMAPEQAVGGEVDARTDVYALGAVLFEILTLQSFHPKGDFEDVVQKITMGIEARTSVRAPEADVPPELEKLCVKATRLQPADRLESAMLLRDAIEAYLDGDRDLELRREASRKHAEVATSEAETALRKLDDAAGSSDAEAARTNALGEVGKALALDPENKEALETLVRLLTTPPKVMPVEIAKEHEADLRKNMRRGGIAAAVVYGYISLNAYATWTLGVQDVRIFTTAHILWGLAFVMAIITMFRPSYPALLTTFLFGIITSAYVTSVYGPYLLVSSFITMHAVLYAFVRDWRPRIAVIAISCLAWTLSVFGDGWGLFPKTVRFIDGSMTIHSTVINLPETSTTIYLYASVLATIIAPSLVVGALRSAYQRSEVKMRLQSWQLSQLVTKNPPGPPKKKAKKES